MYLVQVDPKADLNQEADTPASLASRAAAGDTSAASLLLRKLSPEMSRVVRGVMGAYTTDAEDALQQSLVAFIQALPSFRGECPVAGFACRIAFRTALGVRKRARTSVHRYAPTENVGDDVPDHRSPESISLTRRRTDTMRVLMEEIPVEQAEALALRIIVGWSIEQIAESSGAPINTVRSRLRLAKEALRKKIESDPELQEALGVRHERH